jgi:hypothetical protein
VRGGCEAILHTVQQALEEDPNLGLLQGDLENAYCKNMKDSINFLYVYLS